MTSIKSAKTTSSDISSVRSRPIAIKDHRHIKDINLVDPSLLRTVETLLSYQREDGYWWFTLEANESISAEFIFLMHFLELVDPELLEGISKRIQDVQRHDGAWSIYYDGPPDLSATIECYFALKLAGRDIHEPCMTKARDFILENGGIEQSRVFTRIHLALFGIVPWNACPTMPVEAILLPKRFPINIYSFSSWARASIVPLLIVLTIKPARKLPNDFTLEELFVSPEETRKYRFNTQEGIFSWEYAFIHLDRILKKTSNYSSKLVRNIAINKAKKWIWEHLERVEDIFPALSYAAIASKALGIETDAIDIKKPFEALKMFQQRYSTEDVPALPDEIRDDGATSPSKLREAGIDPVPEHARTFGEKVHQQCCISPVWDTPWMAMALLEAGVPPDHPALVKTAEWLLKKQIIDVHGDWTVRCPNVKPGGWAFEFENDYFPDVDDTIEVLQFLHRVALPASKTWEACQRGIDWILAMQNDDGGWGAFDRNNDRDWVNRIPFSDHGACLDPSSPDITGRVIELLIAYGFSLEDKCVKRGVDYLQKTQETFGGWYGRWGVNFVYGTWCVLTGLAALQRSTLSAPQTSSLSSLLFRGSEWLSSTQNNDGGWGESPEGYVTRQFVPLRTSTASQTAWGLMGLVAAGKKQTPQAHRAAEFLLRTKTSEGVWEERHHTGTGFPGHFYIRYHGYRHFFPLLALARYFRS